MSVMAPVAGKKLVAATFTPFTEQGEIKTSEIGPYIDYLTEKQQIKSIFVNGTTGEGLSLSVAERKSLAEAWCEKAKGKLDEVIVNVGCLSLKDSQELAQHAQQIGAHAIAVIAPFFFKPSNADVLRTFLQEVASCAPSLDFYYYHIPGLTGVNVPVRDVLEGIETCVPRFKGVKFSGSDLMDLGQCITNPPQWSILYGLDEQLLAALALGANGAVGSTYNYVGRDFNRLISAFENGDLHKARTIQFKLQELLCSAMKLGRGFDVGVNKQLMIELSGLSLGPPRLPVMPCRREDALTIAQKFHQLFPED